MPLSQRILVVEDSHDAFRLVEKVLGDTFDISNASSLSSAFTILSNESFDLILLDVNLPDGDGFQFASLLRGDDRYNHLPILFLTARNSISDAVFAFTVGADDFISKPFEPLEFKARISNFLRKTKKNSDRNAHLQLKFIEIDRERHAAYLTECNEKTLLNLTRTEFKILLYLCLNAGKDVTREQIQNFAWGKSTFIEVRSVDTHISKLRRALGDYSCHLKSVHGRGYSLRI